MRSIEKKQTKEIQWSRSTVKCRLVVSYGMTYLSGNNQPYFSITADEEYMTRYGWRCSACGCMHDEIIKAFPSLKRLIPFHLSNQDGLPMHYESNARYWWQQKEYEKVCDHLRMSPSNINIDYLKSIDEYDFMSFLESRKPRMKAEFEAAMAEFNVEYIDISNL